MRKAHYVLIPFFYMLVALSGRLFTASGSAQWYQNLEKPAYTPPGSIIGGVWTAIYILTAFAFITYVNRARGSRALPLAAALFVLNGVINASWSYVFFVMRSPGLALADAALLWLTVLALAVLVWPRSKESSVLLVPYLAWTAFATLLSYRIFELNR
ncbi:MAG: tryptophan-rich sensory protein [Nitrospirota bacterium]